MAKVVEAKTPPSYLSVQHEHTDGPLPAMLETTAAVHPGASGGAVINSDGHMIGLVTRYSYAFCKIQMVTLFRTEWFW